MKKFAIGVDIGGSHITSAVIDLKNKLILKNSFSAKRHSAKCGTLKQICQSGKTNTTAISTPTGLAGA